MPPQDSTLHSNTYASDMVNFQLLPGSLGVSLAGNVGCWLHSCCARQCSHRVALLHLHRLFHWWKISPP